MKRVDREVAQGKEIPDIDRASDFIDKPLLNAKLRARS